ncbi:ATP-binding cassette subfamily B protein [Paenibacillus shirakamiensis]|uniref:ATP-binding cassette subfamily B protein n=1 Tax=Paenibacillus shirakamiensis TaxID=1265935 RepID=A0ABS4JGV4_9BACL|nr:ABC transporter ATP-binding protein [Paenibacillus shirakamiensis]MBP2000948.1 ATP-binding cassette subfamily B protein [Paenibacillus shirakamiensis]
MTTPPHSKPSLLIKLQKSVIVFESIMRLLRTMTKIAMPSLILAILINLATATLPVLDIFLTKNLVDEVTRIIGQRSQGINVALGWLSAVLSLQLISIILQPAYQVILTRIKLKMNYHFDQEIALKSSRLPLVYFDSAEYYDKYERAQSLNGDRGIGFIEAILHILQSVLSITGFLYVLFQFHFILGLGFLLIMIPSLLIHLSIGKLRFHQMFQQTTAVRKINYLMGLMTKRDSAKELRIFNLTPYLLDKVRHYYWQNANEQIALQKRSAWSVLRVDGLSKLLQSAAIGFLIWTSSLGRMTIGSYVALVQAMSSSQGYLFVITNRISNIYESALYVRNIYDYLELPEEDRPDVYKIYTGLQHQGIEVNNLYFKYPNRSEWILDNISLQIRPGEKIAIVGDNGAGKSTLVKCLLGLYKPVKGNICYGGVNIQHIDPAVLSESISATFQDYVCYQFPLRENIGLGSILTMDQDELIQRAAFKGQADQIAAMLPHGYDTDLGHAFGEGQELSQGQWQKIALSRAFLRDAEVVVLDEPTAALDPMAEAAVFERFIDLSEGKTSIFISHRLGSCRMADRILVLRNGKIVEDGHHSTLMNADGPYAQMFRLQAKWYTDEKVG